MNPALFVAAVAGAGWGILGAACAMPWFHEAAWVPAWFGPVIGLGLARVQARLGSRSWPVSMAVAAVSLTAVAIFFGAGAQATLEIAPRVHTWITGEMLPAPGGPLAALTRVAASAGRTGVGVWTSGLAVVLWPLATLTHVLLQKVAAVR